MSVNNVIVLLFSLEMTERNTPTVEVNQLSNNVDRFDTSCDRLGEKQISKREKRREERKEKKGQYWIIDRIG